MSTVQNKVRMKKYTGLSGTVGFALKRDLPEAMVQEALSVVPVDAQSQVFYLDTWRRRVEFLVSQLSTLPISRYYIMLGIKAVHIDGVAGCLNTVFLKNEKPIQTVKKVERPIVSAAKDSTVILLCLFKENVLLKFFHTVQTMFGTSMPDNNMTVQEVHNAMMISMDTTLQALHIDTELPWEWHSGIILDVFFEKLETLDAAMCIG